MSRTPEKIATFEVSGLAGAAEVIGGVTYYRVRQSTFLPWASRFCFHTIKWAPRASHIGGTLADPPVPSATVGAGEILAPARCAFWLVPSNGVVLDTPNLTPASSNCGILYPGDAVDVGGWFGDILLSEGPAGSTDEAWDWTNGAHQAALGPAFSVVIDQAIAFLAAGGATVLP